MTYCIHCQTELPEGARYCFICGEAVSQIDQGAVRRIGRGELLPVIKEQPTSGGEFVRIRDVVSVSDEAAALVVYCHPSQQGQTIRVRLERQVAPRVRLNMETVHASVVARQVGGKTFYAAIFPRIYFLTDKGEKASVTEAECVVKGLSGFRGLKHFVEFTQAITLYPGIITEVDWSTVERIEDDFSV